MFGIEPDDSIIILLIKVVSSEVVLDWRLLLNFCLLLLDLVEFWHDVVTVVLVILKKDEVLPDLIVVKRWVLVW